MRCTHKAVHTKGGLATGGGLLLKGVCGGVPRIEPKYKAVHTQGGLWPAQECCDLRGVWRFVPASSKEEEQEQEQKAHGGGGVSERAGGVGRISAAQWLAGPIGRPNHRPRWCHRWQLHFLLSRDHR